jgi:uncharacterized membrane protein
MSLDWRKGRVLMTGRISVPRGLSPLWLAAILSVFSPEVAQAHGKHVNLTAYCAAANKSNALFQLTWVAKYSKQRSAWTCYSSAFTFAGTKEYESPLDPRKACEWRYGLTQAHFHQGDDVTLESSVHCGEADGLVARDALTTTMLRLCNNSATPRLRAAYASWDTRNRNHLGWTSEGWYAINRGECIDLEIDEGFTGDVYIFGMEGYGMTGATWEGPDARFCVDIEKSFEVLTSDEASCGSAPYKRVGMFKYAVSPGMNTWNFRD